MKKSTILGTMCLFGVVLINTASASLSLEKVMATVLDNDFQLDRTRLDAEGLAAEAASKNVLPDPVIFAGLQNIPTDTFDLDQEAMTQLRVGIKQMFPKGSSLALNESILRHAEAEQGYVFRQLQLKLRQQTETAWLEAWYWQKNKVLIEQDRVFLTQMLDFMQSVYQLGGNNQSDLLGAELELIRLDEKLLEAERQYQTYRLELNTLANTVFHEQYLSADLVKLPFSGVPSEKELTTQLQTHPAFMLLEEAIDQLHKKISLSEQDFEPQWGVELSYGLRQDMSNGTDRADLLSAGFSVQVPLFSRPQKTNAVRAIKYKLAALENKRLEQYQKVYFELQNLAQQYLTTLAQRELYESQILPTLAKQKDSAIQSYESDKGDFRVVTDLYLKEQSTRIKLQRLYVNEQQLISKMNYWLNTGNAKPMTSKEQILTHANKQEMQP